jgi:hypothetical protein
MRSSKGLEMLFWNLVTTAGARVQGFCIKKVSARAGVYAIGQGFLA